MATYTVELKKYSFSAWAVVDFGLSLDAARKEMARLAEEYWARLNRKADEAETKPNVMARIAEAAPGEEISTDFCDGWGLRIVEDEVELLDISVDDDGVATLTMSDGREIKPGTTIVASDGRKGVVTEVRPDNVYEDDPRKAAIFARPADCAYRVPFRNGTLIMATWWTFRGDGKLHGFWADSPSNTELTAEVEA